MWYVPLIEVKQKLAFKICLNKSIFSANRRQENLLTIYLATYYNDDKKKEISCQPKQNKNKTVLQLDSEKWQLCYWAT